MTGFRLVPLHLHGAFELLVGLALMGAPFAFGLSDAAIVAGLATGAIVTGLALRVAIGDDIDISAHYAADIALVAGLIAGAVVLALVGDPVGAFVFVTAAIAALVLNVTTRYSARR